MKKINRYPGLASAPWLEKKTLVRASWWTAGLTVLLFVIGIVVAITPGQKNTPPLILRPLILGSAKDEWHIDERRPQIGQELVIPVSDLPTMWVEVPKGTAIYYSNWTQVQLTFEDQTISEIFWGGPGIKNGPFKKKWHLIRFLNTGERNVSTDVVASIRPYR